MQNMLDKIHFLSKQKKTMNKAFLLSLKGFKDGKRVSENEREKLDTRYYLILLDGERK